MNRRNDCLPPRQIVPRLAEQGKYVAAEATFYRILREVSEQHHRGRSRPPRPPGDPPRLCARVPGEVWTWDISGLPGPVRGLFFYLYLSVDLYRRQTRRLGGLRARIGAVCR